MSAMMASGAPGPIPVPQYSVSGIPPQSNRVHGRQPSLSGKPPQTQPQSQQQYQQSGDASNFARRDSRASRNPPLSSPSSPQQQQPPQQPASGYPEGQQTQRPTNSGRGHITIVTGEPQNQPRVQFPQATGRPATSTGQPSNAGPSFGVQGASSSHQRQSSQGRSSSSHQRQQSQSGPSQAGPSNSRPSVRQPEPTQQSPTQPQPQPQTQPQPQPQFPARPVAAPSPQQPVTNTFPHAFERWEMLSSRWEGLTGYWISRLEQNRHELAHLPLEQQMSRQITDLSAAGANLFHAVVELQRLRASSERKFQRWFFETRSDQERAREMSSELERSVRSERQKRADAVTTIQKIEREKAVAEKLVEEMRRELQISREECRRAWEELGRREQEERERTNSLREGHPTIVGGVQGATNQHSGEQAIDLNYGYGEPQLHHEPHLSPSPGQMPQGHNQQSSTAAATAPSPTFEGSSSPVYSPPTNPPPQRPNQQQSHDPHDSQRFYQHPNVGAEEPFLTNPPLHNRHSASVSETSDEEEAWELDSTGQLIIDSSGNPIPTSYRHQRPRHLDEVGGGAAATEQDLQEELEMERRYGPGGFDFAAGSGEPQERGEAGWGAYPDYDGTGYGGNGQPPHTYGSGWEGVPRHHHPTRLSDVPEEEERTVMSVSDGRRSSQQ